MKVLLLTPPMTQINTPYPATAYLTGFLREKGFEVHQADLSLELFLQLFSRSGLEALASEMAEKKGKQPPAVRSFLENRHAYFEVVDAVVRFLQHKDSTLAYRLDAPGFLPRGPRFAVVNNFEEVSEDGLGWAFGQLGVQDRALYLASLFVDDIADAIRDGIDPHFELSRYGEKLAASAPSFDPIHQALLGEPTLVDETLDALTLKVLRECSPDVVGLTVPFPGNVYGAFRIAQVVRKHSPKTKIILGGGYVNTELRELAEPRVFDFVDFITLDDGERPFLTILEELKKGNSPKDFLRTFVRESGKVVFKTSAKLHDIPFKNAGTPTYEGLKISQYVSLCEMPNPMHRLWSDGRWNKLTLAHGCYWKKCSFCDTSLDYIGRYEPETAEQIVDKMESLIRETGQSGFHFVDEAAPPKLLGAMAKVIIERGLVVTWWANIRFEKTFTPELAELLSRSGCIAMSGGLEVASDRLLKLMEKGVTVEQVARVTNAFSQNGILVHAYLMYGFPTQTAAETVDSLERVRQLFAAGCIQSAFWHRFAATVHSPIGKNPEKYGITLKPAPSNFAKNDVAFEDSTGVDHDRLYPGLRKALYNYMLGMGLEEDVRSWFDFPVAKPTVSKRLVENAISESQPASVRK